MPISNDIFSTAFLVSKDRTIVAEYLQARRWWTMLRIQFGNKMRRHQRAVNKMVRRADMGFYRVLSLTPAGLDPSATSRPASVDCDPV